MPRPELRLVPLGDAAQGLPSHVGDAELVGAYEVRASGPSFGGISGAAWAGDRLLLLSDRSLLFTVAPDGAGFGGPLTLVDELALRSAEGAVLDAEALTTMPDGSLLVANEGDGRILAFDTGSRRARDAGERIPAALRDAPENEWVEGMTRLPDGSLLVLSEGADQGGNRIAAALRDETGWRPLRWQAGAGFRPTDAAAAGEHVLVIERRLSLLGGWQTRLVALPLTALETAGDDELLVGREIATISGSLLGENYEALAVRLEAQGSYRLVLLADDNYNGLQRTLMLDLRWRPDRGESAGPADARKAALRPPSSPAPQRSGA